MCNFMTGHRPVVTVQILRGNKDALASLPALHDRLRSIWDGNAIVDLAGCRFVSFAPGVCLLG
jgi:hypothetical protein